MKNKTSVGNQMKERLGANYAALSEKFERENDTWRKRLAGLNGSYGEAQATIQKHVGFFGGK